MGTPTSTTLCTFVESQSTQQLLYHYRCLIASKLAWIDSVDNPWRSIILPMAMESPSLLFSILSMAAGDLSSKLSNTSTPNDISRRSDFYRELAIKRLAIELGHYVATTSTNSLTPKGATTTLAATLVLCNLEVKLHHSTRWPIHLRAARAVIHSCAINEHLSNAMSDTHSFLLQKFNSMNAFASMSTFEDLEEATTENLEHQRNKNDNVFLEVLEIMQQVTRDQRRVMVNHQHVEPATMDSCKELRDKLSQARRKTAVLFREAPLTDSVITRSDLAAIADMFYYAGLIYSHQVLALQCCHDELGSWSVMILDKLDSLKEVGSFCQNLLWPLFVAATEIQHWNEERQRFLETRIQQIVELSGHWNGLRVLDFLRNYWELGRVGSVNWIDLAKDWAQRGEIFIVI